ncbi:hypothetical protein BWI17_15745 [Betaproteobacteria bacterium GR16-43]|nr:hypothetical protein BWI17_15745 [Betaproteobacteria bacterium GR16-43]
MTDPQQAEAHYQAGSTLHAQGRLNEAIALYAQAIAANPAHSEAHNNLGSAFQSLGRRPEAVESFGRAVSCNPASAYFRYNFGTALQDVGRLDEAVAQYQHALAVMPQLAPAHFNIANARKDQGRFEEAVAAYRKAVTLKPDYAEAFNNLGWVLASLGRTEEAIASYRKTLALVPGVGVPHHNLARVFLGLGRYDEALESCTRALSLGETPEYRATFAECLRHIEFTRADPALRRYAARALSDPWARPVDLARAGVRLAKLLPASEWPGDALVLALLASAPVTDPGMERELTRLRRILLEESARAGVGGVEDIAPSAFHCALARQCLLNEFVFSQSEEEVALANELRAMLEASLVTGKPVPASWVVAVASYFPLRWLASAPALLERSWPDGLQVLLDEHIVQPLRERAERETVARLTPVEEGVSRSVQQQYEENPYPRWQRLPPAPPPSAPSAGLQVLVAGCGTGREPIELASQFEGARILAIDLSLASLGYAKRKAVELGRTNIEFAQADILALGPLGKTFDFISSVGVLHHMADPAAGLRQLVALLRPGGTMLLGLYSEAARRGVVAARQYIAERGYAPDAEGIRRCRADLMALDDASPLKGVTAFHDFYAMSECRDLLFHVQEHRFTLLQVAELLANAGLAFTGFVLDPQVFREYAKRFPDDAAGTNLRNWAAFEEATPEAFSGMYVFLARKAGERA